MKNKVKILVIILVSAWFLPASAWSGEGWEADLLVSSGHVSSRLAIGQRSDATDQRDGRYDVPPMLAGSLRAWLLGSGDSLWRDIRSGGAQEWRLVIDNRSGEAVSVSWSPASLPVGVEMVLANPDSGRSMDMHGANSFTLADPAGGEIVIRLTY